jgi:hypothetical protein
MPLKRGNRSDGPGPGDVDAQLGRFKKHLSEMQEFLLHYLIMAQREIPSRWEQRRATGARIMFEFYVKWDEKEGRTPPSNDQDEHLNVKARQEVKALRAALQKYYLTIAGKEDHVLIEIPEGNKYHYEPEITYRDGSASFEQDDFEYIGNGGEALKYLTERIPHATRIEDTTVRWNVTKSTYSDLRAYSAALNHSAAEFRSITAPVQDEAYVNALREAYGQRRPGAVELSGQLKCFRLHHAIPLMNFVLIYEKHKPAPEVLFGYGTQREDQPAEETPVFRSNHPLLVKEFQRLFKVLCSHQFSKEISIDDPEFLRSRARKCDVLATFEGFPEHEIKEKIQDCQKRIAVCATVWQTFQFFKMPLKKALRNGCSVEVAIWNKEDPFVELRGASSAGDSDDLKSAIETNEDGLEAFKNESKFELHRCSGQGSVTIFWIDDLIYFSPYWVGGYAFTGPHFMVRADSDTGKYLQDQYKKMIPARTRKSPSFEG